MPKESKREEPIRVSVRVDCPIEDAFRLFTEAFAEWWPLARYSTRDDQAETCVIEPWIGGRVFERSRSGEEHDWGEVICWHPPERLSFAWDPGGTGDQSQAVDVGFEVDADGTRVTLVHTGWEAPGVAVCALKANCKEMWPDLLKQLVKIAATQMLAIA